MVTLDGLHCTGALLDYEATKRNLENGKIGALGLDVQWQEPFDPEDPIAKHPRSAQALLIPAASCCRTTIFCTVAAQCPPKLCSWQSICHSLFLGRPQ